MLRERSLLQIDTSFHAWFEDRGPACGLMGAIDDATGNVISALPVQGEPPKAGCSGLI